MLSGSPWPCGGWEAMSLSVPQAASLGPFAEHLIQTVSCGWYGGCQFTCGAPGVRVWPVTFSFHLSHLCVLELMVFWVFLTGTHQMSKSFLHQEIAVLNRHENGKQAEMFKPKQAVAWGSAVWSYPQNGLCRVTAVKGEEQGLLSRWDQQGRHS